MSRLNPKPSEIKDANDTADLKAKHGTPISLSALTNVKYAHSVARGEATADYHTPNRIYNAVRERRQGDVSWRWYLKGSYTPK